MASKPSEGAWRRDSEAPKEEGMIDCSRPLVLAGTVGKKWLVGEKKWAGRKSRRLLRREVEKQQGRERPMWVGKRWGRAMAIQTRSEKDSWR